MLQTKSYLIQHATIAHASNFITCNSACYELHRIDGLKIITLYINQIDNNHWCMAHSSWLLVYGKRFMAKGAGPAQVPGGPPGPRGNEP